MLDAISSRLRGRGPAEIGRLVLKNVRHAIDEVSPAARARRDADRAFDKRWGTDTSGGVSVHDLGIAQSQIANCHRYDPSDEAMLRDPLAALGVDPAEYDFIDYGAGKGRMMMLAMEMGFRSVTGVELSSRLCETARSNLQRFTAQHDGMASARLFEGDAAAFRPEGTDLLVYMYNPFDATIMQHVRARIEEALSGPARRAIIVYANPECRDVFLDAPRWRAGPSTPGVATFLAEAAA